MSGADAAPPAWARAMEERLEAAWANSTVEILARINAVRGHQDDQHAAVLGRLDATQEGGVAEQDVAERAERQVAALRDVVSIQAEQIGALQRQIHRLRARLNLEDGP